MAQQTFPASVIMAGMCRKTVNPGDP